VHRRSSLTVAAVCGVALLVGCTPTARTPGPYAAKAKATARAVHSSVASDLLLIDAVRRGHTFAPFVSTSTSQAEDEASDAANTFLGIQPPDDDTEQLRSDFSEVLNRAEDALSSARIAARRGDNDALLATQPQLQAVDEVLQAIAEGTPPDQAMASSSP